MTDQLTKPRLEIQMEGIGQEKITLDGQEIQTALQGLTLVMKPGELPTVCIWPLVKFLGMTLDGPQIFLAPEAALVLNLLGWVEPEMAAHEAEVLAEASQGLDNATRKIHDLEQENAALRARLEELDSPDGP